MEANKLIEIEAHNDDQQTSFATPSQQAYASKMDPSGSEPKRR